VGASIAVLAALREEMAGLEEKLSPRLDTWQAGSISGVRGQLEEREVLLVQTGVGGEAARRAAETALGEGEVEAALSIGFAGALDPGLQAGELVLCRRVSCWGEGENPVVASDAGLLAQAFRGLRQADLPFSQGEALTVPRFIATAEEKRRLSRALPARIVEMESYWVGRVAQDRGVPFLAIRAVSDTTDENLVGLGDLVDGSGRIRWGRAIVRLLGRPTRLPGVLRMGRNLRRAQLALTSGVEAVLRGM
jgi:adenosylhomocysteine nucleosidase